MGIKLSGMVSGMDTDSIIKELMSAQSMKKTKIEKKQTLNTWKMEKWQELNKKIYALYTGSLTNMTREGQYLTKKVSCSDETRAGITAGINAPKGSHTLEIEQLASAQYLTGGKLQYDTKGGTVTAKTKLTDMGITENTVIKIAGTDPKKAQELVVNSNTTISDFVKVCGEAGLTANFDENQKRLFISSKESGAGNKFTITTAATSSDYIASMKKMEDLVGYSSLSQKDQDIVSGLFTTIRKNLPGSPEYDEAKAKLEDYAKNNSETFYKKQYDKALSDLKAVKESELYNKEAKTLLENNGNWFDTKSAWLADSSSQAWRDSNPVPGADATAEAKEAYAKKEEAAYQASQGRYESWYTNQTDWLNSKEGQKWSAENPLDSSATPEDIEAYEKSKQKAYETAAAEYKSRVNGKIGEIQTSTEASFTAIRDNIRAEVASEFDDTAANPLASEVRKKILEKAGMYTAGDEALTKEELIAKAGEKAIADIAAPMDKYQELGKQIDSSSGGTGMLNNIGLAEITGEDIIPSGENALTVTRAKDSIITLDGAKMTNASNDISVNGITINLKKAEENLKITFNVSDDTDATYNLIKGFVKDFNAVLKEMNELYYADRAKGYEPLTEEERDAMSEEEIEKWEKKIKDSMMRRDDTIGGLTNAMKAAIMMPFRVDGRTASLSMFGIGTSSDYTERGLLHIKGDEEDSGFAAGQKNELKEFLESDPEFVMKSMVGITKSLYDTMNKKMAKTSLSSAMKFYNDVQMKKQDDEYKTQLKNWEKKLADMENRYYKQFTAMEVALSKLQNQGNSLAGFFGQSQ